MILSNCVILATHFCYSYSMWDFTYMCILNNFSLTCESVFLCTKNKFYQLSFAYDLLPLPKRHPWAFPTPSIGTMCQPRMLIHGNQLVHSCPLELRVSPCSSTPLATLLCWEFFYIFCVGSFGLLCSLWGSDLEDLTTFTAHHP